MEKIDPPSHVASNDGSYNKDVDANGGDGQAFPQPTGNSPKACKVSTKSHPKSPCDG